MRIVEPNKSGDTVAVNKRKNRSKKPYIIVAIVVMSTASVAILASKRTPVTAPVQQQQEVAGDTDTAVASPTEPVEFSSEFLGNEFRLLYDFLLQPNTSKVALPPPITGNDVADTRIRQLAEKRGYKLRKSPLQALPIVDGHPLQPLVRNDWFKLKRAAQSTGLGLSITSGYRSIAEQRTLFLRDLSALGVTTSDIVAGVADKEINTVLVTTAIPGYSKHHTGYTVDLLCSGFAFENFKNSTCYDWLSDNNYAIAKTHGFIPSYPSDADLQGPDPEAWEYVWVGTAVLYP